jgi:hypothetical protein
MIFTPAESLANVNVTYGIHRVSMPLAGLTVEEIQVGLGDVLNVGREVEAYLNGKRVAGHALVCPDDWLEFMRTFGRKGSSDLPGDESARRKVAPPGAPAWITDELIELTLRTFQPRYDAKLTPEDAMEMLVTFSRVADVLREDL